MPKRPNAIRQLKETLEFLDALAAQIADTDAGRMRMKRYGLLVPIRLPKAFDELSPKLQRKAGNEDNYLAALKVMVEEDRASQLEAVADCMGVIRRIIQMIERSEAKDVGDYLSEPASE